MRFSAAFVAAALALSVAALPSENTRKTIRVPLSTRSDADFLNPDGTANPDRLRRHVSSATRNVRRGLEVYERNTGRRHPWTRDYQHEKDLGREALQKVYQGNLWQGTIEVGTPPKELLVDFVTGISEFFLPGPGCTGCTNHTGFDPTSSTTSKNTGKEFTWLSVDGSTVNGTLYSDNVKIAGLTAYNQIFGLAKNVTTNYWLYLFPTDGLLGLGFPETSQFNATPVFHNMIEQDAVKEPRFGLKLADTGSELTLGGVNPKLYKGPFHYSPLTTKGLWQIEMDSLKVDGVQAVGKNTVSVDSGIRLIIGEINDVKALMSKVPGAKDGTTTIGPGFYSIPCNYSSVMTLSFGGKSWDIPPEIFNLAPLENTTVDCLSGVSGVPTAPNSWIIGDVFLRSVYSVWDVGRQRIGFAQYA